jgi:DNA replication and repair protein RecF
LERLRVRDFRNIPSAEIVFKGHCTVVLGSNGQGKTNLLEAVHLLCLTKAFRTNRLNQLVRRSTPADDGTPPVGSRPSEAGLESAPQFLVEGDFESIRRGRRQARALLKEGALVFELDGSRCRGRDYYGQLPLVLLSPESLDVSQGGPDERRRTLDRLLSAASPLYLDLLLRYQRALRQRTALLAREGSVRELELWELELSQSGLELTRRRRDFTAELSGLVRQVHAAHFSPSSTFDLGYEPSLDEAWNPESCQQALAEAREGDQRRGWARLGPHRDELPVRLGDLALRNFGSQGQHKLFMLCLVLAETRLLQTWTGETPILLLDDLFGLLDDEKIRALASAVDPGLQVLISTTSLRHLDALGEGAQVLHCENGRYREDAA